MSPDLRRVVVDRRTPRVVAAVVIAAYAVVQGTAAWSVGFHPAVNDTLGVFAIARGIDWADPQTLHNGFFPIGLPAVLALLPTSSWLVVGAFISLGFAVVALAATWIGAARLATPWWAVLAVVVLCADPTFASYAASAGPDMIALGLAAAGVACYVAEATRGAAVRTWVVVTAGLLTGLAGVFRYHAIVLGLGLLAWTLVQRRRPRAALFGAAVGGLALGYAPQVVANALGGYGPFASTSAFTMYQSVVDINWLATGAIDPAAYASAWTVVSQHPLAFATAYAGSASAYVVPVVLVAIALLVRRRTGVGAVLVSLLVAAVGYAAVVSTGNSPRGVLLVLPLAAIAVAVIADRAFDLTRAVGPAWQRTIAIIVLAVAILVVPQVHSGLADLQSRTAQERERTTVDGAVARYGLAERADQVLTNDFGMYLTSIPGIGPDTIGGWTDVSLNGDTPHRDVDVSSARGFVCDAAARGIRLVVWSPGGTVPGMADDLAAALSGAASTTGLRDLGAIGSYRATAVEPGFVCP